MIVGYVNLHDEGCGLEFLSLAPPAYGPSEARLTEPSPSLIRVNLDPSPSRVEWPNAKNPSRGVSLARVSLVQRLKKERRLSVYTRFADAVVCVSVMLTCGAVIASASVAASRHSAALSAASDSPFRRGGIAPHVDTLSFRHLTHSGNTMLP